MEIELRELGLHNVKFPSHSLNCFLGVFLNDLVCVVLRHSTESIMGAAGFSFHMTVIPAPEFLSCPRPTSLALVGLPCLFLLVVPRRSEEGSVAGGREKQRKHILGQACPVLLVIAVLPHLLFGGASLRNLLESILCRIDLMMIGQLRIIFTPLFLCSLVRLLVRPEMHWRSTLPKRAASAAIALRSLRTLSSPTKGLTPQMPATLSRLSSTYASMEHRFSPPARLAYAYKDSMALRCIVDPRGL